MRKFLVKLSALSVLGSNYINKIAIGLKVFLNKSQFKIRIQALLIRHISKNKLNVTFKRKRHNYALPMGKM